MLRREYGLPAGLAGDGITLYDPCLGCGAFFFELVDVLLARAQSLDSGWGERLRGCELLPVPYLLAQLRLGLRLLQAGSELACRGEAGGFCWRMRWRGEGFPR